MRPALLPGAVPRMPCRRFAAAGPFRWRALALIALGAFQAAAAGPFVPAGDAALRADIQLLADHGVLSGPVTTWPLSWGPIMADLEEASGRGPLPPHVSQALVRGRAAADRHTITGSLALRAVVAGASKPPRLRSFAATPRESAEIGAGLDWIGDRFAVALNAQLVESPDDGKELRADGSVVGIALGN